MMQRVVASPPSWQPVEIPFNHLVEDAVIIIDPADTPPQSLVPKLVELN